MFAQRVIAKSASAAAGAVIGSRTTIQLFAGVMGNPCLPTFNQTLEHTSVAIGSSLESQVVATVV
jgi:hypothetical protein